MKTNSHDATVALGGKVQGFAENDGAKGTKASGEIRLYAVPEPVMKRAHVSGMSAYEELVAEAGADHSAYWARLAREFVTWKRPFTQSLDDSEAPFFKWFEDGTLNVSYNCLDRQVERGLGDNVAILFEADDGQVRRVT
jgi:acetyl-CoA synthetase